MDKILIRGARTHNLKNVDLELPRDKLIVITGLSGSGKSSLAFDTLYAEGQRRYVESLSAYARQFLSLMEKPDVDHIEGLSPAISIEQKSTSHNPRSTVGTVTEIYDYLRLLYARVGEAHCPTHGVKLEAQTVSQMVDRILEYPEGTKLMLLAPVVQDRKGEHKDLFVELRAKGFVRARVNGNVVELADPIKLDPKLKHTIEVVIDRIKVKSDMAQRLAESIETGLKLTASVIRVAFMDDNDKTELTFSATHACAKCGFSIQELEPKLFSFNSPAGACQTCDGLGVHSYFDPKRVIADDSKTLSEGAVRGWDKRNVFYFHLLRSLAEHYGFDLDVPFKSLPKKAKDVVLNGSGRESIEFHYYNDRGLTIKRSHPFEGILNNFERRYKETESQQIRDELSRYMTTKPCPDCDGSRLNPAARNVRIKNLPLHHACNMAVKDSKTFFDELKLPGQRSKIAQKILAEISARLGFLVNVGLDYLTLDRSAETLSGGEAQRIRLASQIGAGLVGVMYILDEPSIGLHQRDNERLLNTLHYLRDLGNTVIVVEHDEDAIRSADFIVDIGPGAGVHGGQVVAKGSLAQICNEKKSITGQYLSGKQEIAIPKKRHQSDGRVLKLSGAKGNNLKSVSCEIPVGLFTCVTGVSGSGKSTLINDTLYRIAATELNGAESLEPAAYDKIEGLDQFDKVVDIDQSPIGRTPRSNPATYTGLFTPIRELFAETKESRARGYGPGRFSFNVKGGRCEACEGDGVLRVEMHFLPDIYVPCDVCKGKRYNRETLDVTYKGKNISDVLEMTIEDARAFFDAVPSIAKKLQTMVDVGLSYITLGQSATTLSGGEAQRVKLSKELSRRDTGNTLYILDEPTTGLHFHDVKQLLTVLHSLRDHGNTIVVIEHNLDVIKTADWLIDLGPEGGNGGGQIIATGTPEEVAKTKGSHTGRFLKPMLTKK